MHTLRELAGVILAGFLTFFGGIALAIGFVLLWLCGIASGLCLMVAMFAGVMYGITGKLHDGQIALTYLSYAAIPFVLAFIFGYYRNKLARTANQLTERRNTLAS
jgi:membrane protein implicated in regulation of membrane protease activity